MDKSKIIVIDGLDGCGKSTQLEIIKNRLSESGKCVHTISFPDYESQSSALVKMYLNGEFSDDPDDINAYAASSFYAVDRYSSYMKNWKKIYESNSIILAARYVSSNAFHQMPKLSEEKWYEFLTWLYDYEHNKLGLPEADKVIFLDMPINVSQKLLSTRYNGDEAKKDIHESHIGYLEKCRKAALFACETMKWDVIRCSCDDAPLPVEQISEAILVKINEVL